MERLPDVTALKTTPYWWEDAPPDAAIPADLPSKADVVVIGSGFAGLCCALELAEHGRAVVVLDKEALGAGASTRSGAMVTGGQKLVVTQAIRGLSPDRQAALLADAKESLAAMAERVAQYGLDADYQVSGRLIVAQVPGHMARLARWAALLRERAGSEVAVLDALAMRRELDSPRYHGGILIKDYGGLHPAKYHRALRQAARAKGVGLHPFTPATAVTREGDGFRVRTPRGDVVARHVMAGTNGYTGPVTPWLQRRVVPVGAYVIATAPLAAATMAALIPHGRMVSDTQRDLFWFRPSPDGRRIVFGARPFLRESSPERAAPALHRMLRSVFPQLASTPVTHCWRGNVAMSRDQLPHMGVQDGMHYAVACNGSGVAMMSYLGRETARKIIGRQNRLCAFDTDAFPAVPLYRGRPWFLPLASAWYRLQDGVERLAQSRPS